MLTNLLRPDMVKKKDSEPEGEPRRAEDAGRASLPSWVENNPQTRAKDRAPTPDEVWIRAWALARQLTQKR